MKLHFDPNQEYQKEAIKSIVDIFEGQPLIGSDFEFAVTEGSLQFSENGVGNNIVLSEEQILKNLQKVQRRNGIEPVSDELDGMNFSVEMETGTGKTYVYLRTIYELNRNYGFKKFVIVVPSVAIREGVLKNLEITHGHFQNLYDNVPVDFDVYDSKKVSGLRGFASADTIQILVINIDSFAKDENIINRPNDKLTGKMPIEFIQYTRPIVIVDEPQNMETEIRKRAIANLSPSCTLRYSATHLKLYNPVYSLDPVRAYDLGLVKQIEVDSIFTEDSFNDAFVSLEKVSATKTRTAARIRIDVNSNNGVVKKSVTAKVGDDLYRLSNQREIYRDGFIIDEIDVANECVSLTNGTVLYVGDTQGGMTDEIMRFQIQKTVEEHFKKEHKYKGKGIKTLSLFFIDKVANYRKYDEAGNLVKGRFAQWFEQIYNEMASKAVFKGLIPFAAEEVHNGYFAQDKKGRFKDSSEGRATQADDDTYRLIMKDKERLLDINEPLRFIFSHSALREGWDSPNVFQICTLNETKSEMKKRQEIGRGLRLAVDRTGNRVFDRNINRLTVVANESYEDFAKTLQKEIEDDCGVEFKGRIKNRRDRAKIEYRKGFQADPAFLEIWERMKQKTVYRVRYDTEELIKNAAKAVGDMPEIQRPRIQSVKVGLMLKEPGVEYEIKATRVLEPDTEFAIPDILGYIQSRTELTRSTILMILRKSGRLTDVLINPQLFLDRVVKELKHELYELMIDGIKYEKIGKQEYEMMLFEENELETYIDKLVFDVTNHGKTIYDKYIPLDSDIEMTFAKDCETREDIEFYFKLPSWFTINTPIGTYNPDWALIFKNEKKIYFVAETKSTADLTKLRDEERLKIKCGKAHFNEFKDIEYKGPVTSVTDLI
jgi:type III restriction enzyme